MVTLACFRLRDSGEKSFSKKKCEKREGAAPLLKSPASYFHFARFNTSPLSESLAQAMVTSSLKLSGALTSRGVTDTDGFFIA